MSVMSRSSNHTRPSVGSSSMLTQRSNVDFPPPEGPITTTTSRWSIVEVHALEDVEVPEPLVDVLRAGSAAASRAGSRGRTGGLRGLHHPPAPAMPTRPLRRRFSAALTSPISGNVTTRYAIAATVKNVALNVAD